MPHFINPKVGAIAGNAKVGNRVNLWTRWQALEYITSQNFERRALDVLGAVSVVPGAIGAWRVSAVREAGGYHIDTVAEDADLTMALLRRGYRVEYEDMALAYTEAPTNANALMRQRFRWSFGILQAVYKHRGVFARKGALGWVALPNIVIFQILLPLVSPLIDIMFAVGTVWYFVQKHFHPDSTDPASFHKLVLFFFAFLVIDFIASAIAFALERRSPEDKEDAWLLSQVWLQRFAYRQLFSIVLFKTLKRALEGRRFAWDKLERTAAVNYIPSENGTGTTSTCRNRIFSDSNSMPSLAKQQWRELRQIPTPDHPGVHARGFDIHVLDALRLQPFPQFSVHGDEPVFGAARDPQQTNLLVRLRIEGWKVFFELVRHATRTECANPGKLVEIVQTSQQ